MKSKNKPALTAVERRHIERLAAQPCVVCGERGPSEIHEPEQGLWFAAMPLCVPCHRGPDGWHGSRLRWRLRRVTELQAIARAVQAAEESR